MFIFAFKEATFVCQMLSNAVPKLENNTGLEIECKNKSPYNPLKDHIDVHF